MVPVAADFEEGPYTLDSGDKLRIVVFGQDALSNNYTVDAQGAVSLPLIGNVEARGMTTAQLGNAIAARLKASFIRDPSVAVEIEIYRPFFVLGEVTYPGQYPFVPNMTVENAIAIAGGFTPRASRPTSPSPASCRACRPGPRCRSAHRCAPATPSKSANAGSDFRQRRRESFDRIGINRPRGGCHRAADMLAPSQRATCARLRAEAHPRSST